MKLIDNPPFYRLISCQATVQVVRQTAKILIAAAILPFFCQIIKKAVSTIAKLERRKMYQLLNSTYRRKYVCVGKLVNTWPA